MKILYAAALLVLGWQLGDGPDYESAEYPSQQSTPASNGTAGVYSGNTPGGTRQSATAQFRPHQTRRTQPLHALPMLPANIIGDGSESLDLPD